MLRDEAGAHYRGRTHNTHTHVPDTRKGAGIASIPAPVAFVRMSLRRRPFP